MVSTLSIYVLLVKNFSVAQTLSVKQLRESYLKADKIRVSELATEVVTQGSNFPGQFEK